MRLTTPAIRETRAGLGGHRSGKVNKLKSLRVVKIEHIGVPQIETILMEGEVSLTHIAVVITYCQNLCLAAVQ